MNLTALPVIGPRLQRRVARVNYFACGARCGRTLDRIETGKAHTPTQRARTLNTYALLEADMARHNAAGWNPDGLRCGKTNQAITATHENTAELIHLIASTETANGPHDRAHGPADWEAGFGDVLDALSTASYAGDRSDLFNRLYRLAHPIVGGDVAEVIGTLRYTYNLAALKQVASHLAATEA